jgi:hypothetical protein
MGPGLSPNLFLLFGWVKPFLLCIVIHGFACGRGPGLARDVTSGFDLVIPMWTGLNCFQPLDAAAGSRSSTRFGHSWVCVSKQVLQV